MDLQTRKLNLITYLAQLQDESFFEKIENYILTKFEKEDHSEFIPFAVEALIERIEKSEEDFKNGNFKTQEDLENQSANW
ncbi:hypothetical protein [Chryseobacterium aquaticum]|uniref:Uncharacterized protein n=1 Tax=Chryseobacterium aquaticum subsp. greenlandense TaxID=345663 RepID=A0A101CI31_9FLAO|nr:hypothetical protein [Chryseobacterium aquaticum]KUJ56598.1 hypothetical protein AR686_08560 [Chryseobacterium aquaticum subsp. greenlandense]